MSTTTYRRGPVTLVDDDHCGRGRRTVTITVSNGADDTAIRKLNRELAEYGFQIGGVLIYGCPTCRGSFTWDELVAHGKCKGCAR